VKAPLAECAGCPGEGRAFVPPEPARGRIRLAIVGEGPSRNDVERKRPFVGAAGREMMRHLGGIGLGRRDCHWTNAILCDVPERDLEAARKRCSKRLAAELAEVRAPVVVPVGAMAAKSALGRTGSTPIMKWRGSVSRLAEPAAWVLPTIHPTFVMRAPQWAPILTTDMQRVGRVLREGFTPPEEQSGRVIHVAQNLPALTAHLNALGDTVAFDVETVGLGPTQTSLVCFALSDGVITVVVPWSRGRDGRVNWWGEDVEWVALHVTTALRARTTVTHNGPAFDHLVIERYGIGFGKWEDTLLLAHALWPGLKKGLSHVVTACGLDVPPWKELENRTATLEKLWGYNGQDTLYTKLAYDRLIGLLHD
jgi:uracil-DNA glycosylase family 4